MKISEDSLLNIPVGLWLWSNIRICVNNMTKEEFEEILDKAIKIIYENEKHYKPMTKEQLREVAKRLWDIDLSDDLSMR